MTFSRLRHGRERLRRRNPALTEPWTVSILNPAGLSVTMLEKHRKHPSRQPRGARAVGDVIMWQQLLAVRSCQMGGRLRRRGR